MAEKSEQHTPLMQQYHTIKQEHPDTLLFFQVGDFYELFFDDAKQASAFLGIALTARGKNKGEPIPLCGVPLHAKDHYLTKLIKGGFKVAICDQLTEPRPGTVVDRGVTHVLTPGTLTDEKLLDEKSASYLFSFYPGQDQWALVFSELLTAQIWATVIPAQSERILESELVRFFPDEVLVPDTKSAKPFQAFFKKQGYFTTLVDTQQDEGARAWLQNFKQPTIDEQESLRLALHYFYAYIKKTQHTSLDQFDQLYMYQPDDFLYLDAATQRNLELIRNSHDGSRSHTLLSALDGATTPMGSRMIKKWLQRPLLKKQGIIQRQDAVQTFIGDISFSQILQQLLSPIGDLERVVGRIALGRAHQHDYVALKCALRILPEIRAQLIQKENVLLFAVVVKHMGNFESLQEYLNRALHDDSGHDWIIKKGFDQQLDYIRELVQNGAQKILALEKEEQGKTGIASLKIRYNNVHGYYLEITNPNKDLVPERYIRRQTLVGKERYTIPELQKLEHDILQARTHIAEREQEVFNNVKNHVAECINRLRKLSHALAHLDALHGFGKVAYNNGYIRPTFNETRDIKIVQGRHPIVEQNSQTGFIPNDTNLTDEQSLWIITGPNMGGKSTYLRQVALISIMAQCGAFVPTKSAQLALLDRVFTRIGAGDNLAAGKSTFLVEMEETATICTQATHNSLVILDEVGRGTSTFDGLALAQAVIEYLYEQIGARCLFATHYHELTALPQMHKAMANYHMVCKKTNDGIVFVHRIDPGVSQGSFGIDVARLAQLPPQIVSRARILLHELETASKHQHEHRHVTFDPARVDISLLEETIRDLEKALAHKDKLLEKIRSINCDELSPRGALDLLWDLKSKV